MLKNELYQGNKKPDIGKIPEVAKPAGDKFAERTPAEDAAVKTRIDAAWGDKPATGQTPAAYPDEKPNIK